MTSTLCRYAGSRAGRLAGGLAAAIGAIGMLIGSAAEARGTARKPPAVEVRIDAIELATGVVVYNTQLINRSTTAMSDVTLQVGAPQGARIEHTWAPASATQQSASKGIAWRVKNLPASSILGPFAYTARVNGALPGRFGGRRIQAVASWKLPRPGSAAAAMSPLERASQTHVTAELAARPLTPLPGTGVQYFVPTGDRGEVLIERSSVDPPAVGGRTWVATYRVTKEDAGSLVLVVPLRRPAPAHSQLRVAANSGDGAWRPQPLIGTVTPDGLHGAFAVDGNTHYALSAGTARLGAGVADIDQLLGESLAGAAFDALVAADSILAKGEALKDLITSLTSEGVIVIDQGSIWVAIDTDATASYDADSSADDASLTGCTETTCYWYDPSVPACGGGPGAVETYSGGGFSVECDSGAWLACDSDGTCIGSSCAETGDADGDGHCACAEGEDTATCDDDDTNPDVSFAPVPGCQERLCFIDPTTLASLPVSTLEDAALGGELSGLSPTLAGVLEDLLTNYSNASPLDRPTVVNFTAPVASGSVQGAIGVVGRHVAMLLRGELVLSPPAPP